MLNEVPLVLACIYCLTQIRHVSARYLAYGVAVLCINFFAFAYAKIDALILAKAITTTILLIFAFTDKDLAKSTSYKLVAMMLFFAAALEILSSSDISGQSKGFAYLVFLVWVAVCVIDIGPLRNIIGILAATAGFMNGARGVFIAVAIGFILLKLRSKTLKVVGVVGFFCAYTLVMPSLVLNGGAFFDVGKSEIDRSIMNAYVASGLLNGYLFPQPSLVGSSNVLEYIGAESIFVHNYLLVVVAYCGPLIFLLPSRLAFNRRSISNSSEAAAWAIFVLLSLSPESHIARFLLFCIPGILAMPSSSPKRHAVRMQLVH